MFSILRIPWNGFEINAQRPTLWIIYLRNSAFIESSFNILKRFFILTTQGNWKFVTCKMEIKNILISLVLFIAFTSHQFTWQSWRPRSSQSSFTDLRPKYQNKWTYWFNLNNVTYVCASFDIFASIARSGRKFPFPDFLILIFSLIYTTARIIIMFREWRNYYFFKYKIMRKNLQIQISI